MASASRPSRDRRPARCSAGKPEHSLALLDAALRSQYTSAKTLTEGARRLAVAGVEQVRRLLPLADSRAESTAESWLRWVCITGSDPRDDLGDPGGDGLRGLLGTGLDHHPDQRFGT